MWIVTCNSKPATIRRLYIIEKRVPHWSTLDHEMQGYITAPSREKAIELYLHWFGFSWHERAKGIGLSKFITTMENT